jgi:hypothetical protein
MNHPSNAPAGCADSARPEISTTNPIARLADLAHLLPGYRLRASQIDPNGRFCLLQESDLPAPALPSAQPHAQRAALAHLPARHHVYAGDVLLARHAPGYHAHAVLAPAPMTLCAAPLWRIRIRDQASLLPAYLAWYLNTDAAQKMLRRFAGQGSARECLVEGFHSVALRLPPMAIQAEIANMVASFGETVAKAQAVQQMKRQQLEATLLKMSQLNGADAAVLLAQTPDARHHARSYVGG